MLGLDRTDLIQVAYPEGTRRNLTRVKMLVPPFLIAGGPTFKPSILGDREEPKRRVTVEETVEMEEVMDTSDLSIDNLLAELDEIDEVEEIEEIMEMTEDEEFEAMLNEDKVLEEVLGNEDDGEIMDFNIRSKPIGVNTSEAINE